MFKWLNQICCSHDFVKQDNYIMMFHHKYICRRCDKVKYIEKNSTRVM